jgi:cytochrome c oxidase subunit III
MSERLTVMIAERQPPAVDAAEPLGDAYRSLGQQRAASELGMWLFLATELMFFGGLFTAYTVYRVIYPAGFAEGSRHLELPFGATNTVILIVSSVFMVLAVRSAQLGDRRRMVWFLVATVALGTLFLIVKGVEYYRHFLDGTVPGFDWTYAGPYPNQVQLFFLAYFFLTGLHTIHLIIGIGLVVAAMIIAGRSPLGPKNRTGVEMIGLYWHFVDMVWIFLLPLLYLYGVHG